MDPSVFTALRGGWHGSPGSVHMVGAVFVVASALYGDGLAVVPTGLLASVLAWLWFLLPWRGPVPPDTHG